MSALGARIVDSHSAYRSQRKFLSGSDAICLLIVFNRAVFRVILRNVT